MDKSKLQWKKAKWNNMPTLWDTRSKWCLQLDQEALPAVGDGFAYEGVNVAVGHDSRTVNVRILTHSPPEFNEASDWTKVGHLLTFTMVKLTAQAILEDLAESEYFLTACKAVMDLERLGMVTDVLME